MMHLAKRRFQLWIVASVHGVMILDTENAW